MSGTRIGTVFKGMVGTCPLEISVYAKCVIALNENVEKGACEKEFQAMKTCFRNVRKNIKKTK